MAKSKLKSLGLVRRIQQNSRSSKQAHFFSMCKEGMKVLDVGVYPELKYKSAPKSVNSFIKTYPYDPSTYTGLGIEGMEGMDKKYPGMQFVEYDGKIFPFKDNTFDWVFSNAVIEHVGSFDRKLLFLNEMLRVSKNVFFTTPNKFFPMDTHTMVPFIHWNDKLFLRWRAKNNRWMPAETLNLISLSELRKLLKLSTAQNYRITKSRMLGMPMTFTVICSADNTSVGEQIPLLNQTG